MAPAPDGLAERNAPQKGTAERREKDDTSPDELWRANHRQTSNFLSPAPDVMVQDGGWVTGPDRLHHKRRGRRRGMDRG